MTLEQAQRKVGSSLAEINADLQTAAGESKRMLEGLRGEILALVLLADAPVWNA